MIVPPVPTCHWSAMPSFLDLLRNPVQGSILREQVQGIPVTIRPRWQVGGHEEADVFLGLDHFARERTTLCPRSTHRSQFLVWLACDNRADARGLLQAAGVSGTVQRCRTSKRFLARVHRLEDVVTLYLHRPA